MKDSLDYYNNFDIKLINDYVLGNIRIESAITNLGMFIPFDATNILDIGCGLGWSSHEFSKHFKGAKILGIDLSPVLIDKANKLFSNNNLNYEVFDVTKNVPNIKYDAIVMIDVYEHIPINKRKSFHESLKNLINDNGRLILACPSKFHQSWLKKNNPKGLQPVDEDVALENFLDLAKDISGEIIFFEYKKIWNNLDYVYSVIEINPQFGALNNICSTDKIKLENQKSRALRIREKLNIVIDLPNENKSIIFKIKNKLKK
jgi:SAM-dependent methyltransferase